MFDDSQFDFDESFSLATNEDPLRHQQAQQQEMHTIHNYDFDANLGTLSDINPPMPATIEASGTSRPVSAVTPMVDRPFVGMMIHHTKPGYYTEELRESYRNFSRNVLVQPGCCRCSFLVPFDSMVSSEFNSSLDVTIMSMVEWANIAYQDQNLGQDYASDCMNVLLKHGEMPLFFFWVQISEDAAPRMRPDMPMPFGYGGFGCDRVPPPPSPMLPILPTDFVCMTKWQAHEDFVEQVSCNLLSICHDMKTNSKCVMCYTYLTHNMDDPHEFMEFSIWRTKSAHDNHVATPFVSQLRMELCTQLCTKIPEFSSWRYFSFGNKG